MKKTLLPRSFHSCSGEKHLDNLGGQSQHYRCYKKRLKGLGRIPRKRPTLLWLRGWRRLYDCGYEITRGNNCPGRGAAFLSLRLWAQQGKAYGRYRSACYTDTWGKVNKHREKGKAKECNSGTVTG